MKFYQKVFSKTLLLLLVMLFSIGIPSDVSALSEKEITAPAAVLMDAETGKVLYQKNPHEVRACASITVSIPCWSSVL